ncbi:hypothetical protein EDD18DRAFT_1111023 [Armillaria luteobubalina]|uniref:Uncharacterized protein n=1 Tax=Armillaria luteobubalina TaxID=153913 RepID=A0AA39PN84_9AGAR|nr:hypothetical protein EDD18DRAFT_1111023 [Armillaria luteobubalina]
MTSQDNAEKKGMRRGLVTATVSGYTLFNSRLFFLIVVRHVDWRFDVRLDVWTPSNSIASTIIEYVHHVSHPALLADGRPDSSAILRKEVTLYDVKLTADGRFSVRQSQGRSNRCHGLGRGEGMDVGACGWIDGWGQAIIKREG